MDEMPTDQIDGILAAHMEDLIADFQRMNVQSMSFSATSRELREYFEIQQSELAGRATMKQVDIYVFESSNGEGFEDDRRLRIRTALIALIEEKQAEARQPDQEQ